MRQRERAWSHHLISKLLFRRVRSDIGSTSYCAAAARLRCRTEMILPQTPSQTIGPFFKPSLVRSADRTLARNESRGERIVIVGRVLDGDGAPVDDAMVEIWQA